MSCELGRLLYGSSRDATGDGSGSPVLCRLTTDVTNCRRDRETGRLAIGDQIAIEDTGEPKPSPVAPSQDPDLQSGLDEEFPRRAVDRGEIRIGVLSIGRVPAGTRPFPVDGPSHETAAHRVEMDVLDRGQDRLL